MKKLLQFLILILCSCSIDSEESGEKLSFRMLSVCGDSDEEDSFLDSTVFVKNPDGSADAEWKMFWQCGMDSYLVAKKKEDSLFIYAESKQKEKTTCICVASLSVTIPEKYLDAKILVLNELRSRPIKIIYRDANSR